MCQDQGLSHWAKDLGFTTILGFQFSSSPYGFDSGTSEYEVWFLLALYEFF